MLFKLFKVQKWLVPEWGESTLEWTKYFLCGSEETLEAVLRDRYGSLKKYSYDEMEEICIKECEVEML